MPKKDGIVKTYSFDKETIYRMENICKNEKRSQTNLIEYLIDKYYKDNKINSGR